MINLTLVSLCAIEPVTCFEYSNMWQPEPTKRHYVKLLRVARVCVYLVPYVFYRLEPLYYMSSMWVSAPYGLFLGFFSFLPSGCFISFQLVFLWPHWSFEKRVSPYPADHAPLWQPRLVLGLADARTVNAKNSRTNTHTHTHLGRINASGIE